MLHCAAVFRSISVTSCPSRLCGENRLFSGLMALTLEHLNYLAQCEAQTALNVVPRTIRVTGGQSCGGTLTVAAGYPVHNKPPDIQHGGVVVDVKKCDLMIILP